MQDLDREGPFRNGWPRRIAPGMQAVYRIWALLKRDRHGDSTTIIIIIIMTHIDSCGPLRRLSTMSTFLGVLPHLSPAGWGFLADLLYPCPPGTPRGSSPVSKRVKQCIAVNGSPISQLRDVTCHMGSHSVICHPTQVNAPRLNPSQWAGTRFTYPGGMEGWVDLGYPAMHRPGVELMTFRSRVMAAWP